MSLMGSVISGGVNINGVWVYSDTSNGCVVISLISLMMGA